METIKPTKKLTDKKWEAGENYRYDMAEAHKILEDLSNIKGEWFEIVDSKIEKITELVNFIKKQKIVEKGPTLRCYKEIKEFLWMDHFMYRNGEATVGAFYEQKVLDALKNHEKVIKEKLLNCGLSEKEIIGIEEKLFKPYAGIFLNQE